MKKNVLILSLIISFAGLSKAQSYANPESIVYDSVDKRYFISNKGGNTLVQLDSLKNLTNFVTTELVEPKGLLIVGDTLISVNNTSIQGFLLSNASRVINISINGSVFMNDATTDGKGNLFISDYNANKIYKLSLKTGLYSTLIGSISAPNGLLYDGHRNSILICGNSYIKSFNMTDSTLKNIVTTKLLDLDGLARDNCGNIYVSSWTNNTVLVFDSSFQNPPTKISKGFSGSADISIDQNQQILAIPNYNSNTVSFVNLNMGCKAEINYLLPQNNSVGLDDSLKIDWDDVADVSGYELEYSKDSTFYASVVAIKTTNSDTTIKALKFNTQYYWRVRAIGGDKKNLFSGVWKFTTKNTTSISNFSLSNACKVYPNPTNDKINIELSESLSKINDYSITDLSGKVVKYGRLDSKIIDISLLSKGLYILRLKADNGLISKKIVIE